jgi:hypothetical protein
MKDDEKARPVEVKFKFPKEPDTVISKMFLKIGDRETIEAMVKSKEEA